MRSPTGQVLRLLGPFIEIVCVALLLATRGQGRTVGGVRLEFLLYAGFAAGLMVWLTGLILVTRRPAPRPAEDGARRDGLTSRPIDD